MSVSAQSWGLGRRSGKAASIRDSVSEAIISDKDRQIVVTNVHVIGSSAVKYYWMDCIRTGKSFIGRLKLCWKANTETGTGRVERSTLMLMINISGM
jgi:hypothetical protein